VIYWIGDVGSDVALQQISMMTVTIVMFFRFQLASDSTHGLLQQPTIDKKRDPRREVTVMRPRIRKRLGRGADSEKWTIFMNVDMYAMGLLNYATYKHTYTTHRYKLN